MNAIRIAVIGCGNIAQKHIASLAELGSAFVLQAICDLDERRLERFAQDYCRAHYPKVALYTSFQELLNEEAVDLVAITTSSESHARLALLALQSGRHVLIEKPIALSMEEAAAVVKEAKRRGLVAAVSFQARYLPQIQAIKSAADTGRFGAISHGSVSMRWHRSLDYYKAGPWRESWSKGGGLFINQCIHYIDLMQWIMGPVKSVYALAGTYGEQINVENTGAAVLRFQSGAIGLIEASTSVYPSSLGTSISVFGEMGSVIIEGALLNERKMWVFKNEDEEAPPEFSSHTRISHIPLYRDVAKAISSSTDPLVSAAATLNALEIVLAIYSSIATGQVQELPIQSYGMDKMAWRE